ncbi:shikimate dehydrogenase [Desulfosporosinus acididurans]|uniref:Shikimate dehydrogenase (NADP(+)) n=1 Tax=Desulfosporosinus acididurans TaxID=476652 RepID=A0A0J1FTP0_9FIRM|nr:shikimate dehydrogenase [Desulfosporosinus acididurans]KLU66358.1 shikimate dehydrogenase [Desulfosporosinus acididurans]
MEKHFAVIGNPIGHSYSPGMHNAGYKSLGIDAQYHRFQVPPDRLAEAVNGLCALGFSGWNVTLPHKETIIPHLDTLTPQAKRAGAVNTVKIVDGEKIGHNTDGDGFICSIESELQEFADKKAVVLGAGGASKGIALALAAKGMRVHILNRTPEKASELVRILDSKGGRGSFGEFKPGDWLKDVDLLVQTTSLGLRGEPFPFALEGICPKALAVDIIVNAQETSFLQEAKKLGCRVLDGTGMLLHQGALAWEFWLGGQAPIEVMRKGLQDQMQQRERL